MNSAYRTSLVRVTDRFDQLSPRDTAITLRSLGRRFNGAVNAVIQSPDLMAQVDAIGPSTRSLSDLIDEGTRTQGLLLNELTNALEHQEPIIAKAALDASERDYVEDRRIPFDVGLEAMSTDSEASGLRIEGASASELARSVKVVGGTATNPLALGREAARSGIALLKLVEDHVAWLRANAR